MASETWVERFAREHATDPICVIEGLLLDIFHEIRRQMREQGITQEDLAARLGVSQARVSRMLKPRENITLETMGRIAAALDCSWGEITLQHHPRPKTTGNGKTKTKPNTASETKPRAKKQPAVPARP